MNAEQALRNLVAKLDQIIKHPSFAGAFQMAQLHGMYYDGPDFSLELKAAEEVLFRLDNPNKCTICRGEGVCTYTGLADGPEGGFVHTHEEKCPFCDSGVPKEGWETWAKVGAAMRCDRELRGVSLADEAYWRGMSVVELSAMETGRMEPHPREGLDVFNILGSVFGMGSPSKTKG